MASTISVDEVQNVNDTTLKVPELNKTSTTGGSILGSGGIVQVVYSGEMTTHQEFSSGSFVQATELDVKITPKFANSLIWFQGWAKCSMQNTSSNAGLDYQIRRYVAADTAKNSTIAGASWQFYLNREDYTADMYPVWSVSRFDSPNTTNEITYQVWGRIYAGGASSWRIGETNLNAGSDGESSRGHTIAIEIAQ